eukprot:scaffold2279_cov276-Pinguiococcus_pyrenoidosus.AAC.1
MSGWCLLENPSCDAIREAPPKLAKTPKSGSLEGIFGCAFASAACPALPNHAAARQLQTSLPMPRLEKKRTLGPFGVAPSSLPPRRRPPRRCPSGSSSNLEIDLRELFSLDAVSESEASRPAPSAKADASEMSLSWDAPLCFVPVLSVRIDMRSKRHLSSDLLAMCPTSLEASPGKEKRDLSLSMDTSI